MMREFWLAEKGLLLSDIESVSTNRRRQAKALIALSRRIGDKLRTLQLAPEYTPDLSRDLAQIAYSCPNLESLEFIQRGGLLCLSSELFSFAFPNLKSLRFIPKDDSLSLTMASSSLSMPHSVLLSLPASLEVIAADGVGRDVGWRLMTNVEPIEVFFQTHSNLTEVSIYWVYDKCRTAKKAEVFSIIANCCPRLKKLRLIFNSTDIMSYAGLELLSDMIELEVGCYDDVGIPLSDDQLAVFCEKNANIEVFRMLNSLSDVGFHGLYAVSRLTRLRDVYLRAPKISGAKLGEIALNFAFSSGRSLWRLAVYPELLLSPHGLNVIAERCMCLRHFCFEISANAIAPEDIWKFLGRIVERWKTTGSEGTVHLTVYVQGCADDAEFLTYRLMSREAPILLGVNLSIYRHRQQVELSDANPFW